MSPFNSVLLIVFGVIFYMMWVDQNVTDYIVLVFKLVNINIQRFLWMIKYHPNNFVTTYFQNRKYDEIAKKLERELNSKDS